jgi:CBS domain containing-hemolysin-like protein
MSALLLLLTATVLGISFFCSLTEAVLLTLNPLQLQVQERRGMQKSASWLALKNRIERPISAILIFNTLANTGLASLSGALFARIYGAEWLWAYSVAMTLAVLFAGEMTPKILGVHHAERLAPKLIRPLTLMLMLCHPLVVIMEKFCEKLKTGTRTQKSQSDQIMDIITLVQAARAEQLLHNREELIIIHAATLSARRVKTAMVPHAEVKVFNKRLSLKENVLAVGPKLHRSYPVSTDGSLDHIIGYIRVRELFVQNLLSADDADWHQLIRPALHIDGNASLTQLLALYLDRQEVAALVDNSSDHISGWITMDDVMKVLMGARI